MNARSLIVLAALLACGGDTAPVARPMSFVMIGMPAADIVAHVSRARGVPWTLTGQRKLTIGAERVSPDVVERLLHRALHEAGCTTEEGPQGRTTTCPEGGPAWAGCWVWPEGSAPEKVDGVSQHAIPHSQLSAWCTLDPEREVYARPPRK